MNYREYICTALAGLYLSLMLSVCAVAGEGATPPATGTDPDPGRADTAANPTIPTVAEIKVYFKLDPHLTRSLHMGDRWVSPSSFTTTRQPGRHGTVEVRAVGLDYRGQLLNRRLEPEWLAADSAQILVSPTRGNSVTITLQSPAESILHVTYGEVSETLTIRGIYDEQNDLTEVVISRDGPD